MLDRRIFHHAFHQTSQVDLIVQVAALKLHMQQRCGLADRLSQLDPTQLRQLVVQQLQLNELAGGRTHLLGHRR